MISNPRSAHALAHPREQVEYLWVPGAYLQPSGPPELELSEGRVVTVLPVRINASSKARTVEVRTDLAAQQTNADSCRVLPALYGSVP